MHIVPEQVYLDCDTSAVEVPTLQNLSTDGEPSVSRVVLAGKGSSAVVTSGEGSMASGDAREASKREFKKKQLLVARDKEESVAVSVSYCHLSCSLILDRLNFALCSC